MTAPRERKPRTWKAWAVVDARGLVYDGDQPSLWRTKGEPMRSGFVCSDERLVRVTITEDTPDV